LSGELAVPEPASEDMLIPPRLKKTPKPH